MNGEIGRNAQIVHDMVSFVEMNGDEEDVLHYATALLGKSSELDSIYYGTEENTMINASGWVLPEGFDLRTRPWYTRAVENGDVVLTDIFLNASQDKWVITIARPVFAGEGDILGVVGADWSIAEVVKMVERLENAEEQYLLIDGERNVIATSYAVSAGVKLEHISQDAAQAFSLQGNEGIVAAELNGEQGYMLFEHIGNTQLTLVAFVSRDVYASYGEHWVSNVIVSVLFVVLLFLGALAVQRRIVLKPLFALVHDLEVMPDTQDLSHRVPAQKSDPTYFIRESINKVLGAMEGNVLELRESQRRLIDSEARNRAMISALPDVIIRYNGKGEYLDYETNYDNHHLLIHENLVGKNVREVLPEDVADLMTECIGKSLNTGELQSFEYQLTLADESVRIFEARMAKSTEMEVISVVRDITAQRKEKEYIIEISHKDHLTGLYNRRYFEEKLGSIDNAESLPLAIALLDVNGLKLTNDAFGHFAGDQLLQRVAKTLEHSSPDKGFVARIGGDEFAIVCPNCQEDRMQRALNKVHETLAAETISNVVVSVSIGWDIRQSLEQTIRQTFITAENHMLNRKIVESQSMRNRTVKIIMQTLQGKNEREKEHSVQVSEWARKIGTSMGLNAKLLDELETAGLLHDIGKIAVCDELVDKPGPLTEPEYNEIKRHAEGGYQILKSVDAYSTLAECVLSHHERFDGKGYPRGLKGDAIPLMARIIAVADAFQAMVSDRPYRQAMGIEQAIDEILRNAGTQFDPVVVEHFVALFSNDSPERNAGTNEAAAQREGDQE
ncbi:MAG: diguanylate cyclase [Limnochordia bacterium]|nr:diguanylate cyclase [Limnochordia bacterium]